FRGENKGSNIFFRYLLYIRTSACTLVGTLLGYNLFLTNVLLPVILSLKILSKASYPPFIILPPLVAALTGQNFVESVIIFGLISNIVHSLNISVWLFFTTVEK